VTATITNNDKTISMKINCTLYFYSRGAADFELGAVDAFADFHQLGVTTARLLEEVPDVGNLLRLCIGYRSKRKAKRQKC